MTRTAAERRAARKRKQQDRTGPRPAGVRSGAPPRAAHVQHLLLHEVPWPVEDAELDRLAGRLTTLDPGFDADAEGSRLLVWLLRDLWEHGWQPADLVHVVGRDTPRRVVRLAVAAIAAEARTADAAARAPQDWLAQLSGLDAPEGAGAAVLPTWRRAEGLAVPEAWRDVLRLFGRLTTLGPLQELCPPPSRWGTSRARQPKAPSASAADARVLGRIRGLLAKAESTEFPEEAEALSAKAQELMTRHAVDAAVLDAQRNTSVADQVVARRVHVDNPYPEAKVRLLDAVGDANGVRVIWMEALGIATMVGLPVDLDSVDLLFTSLLVQATRAMADTGRAGGGRTRSASFRRAFLTSYAIRVGERLSEVRERATAAESRSRGTDLVPVMRARSEAVDDAFEAMFPDVYQKRARSLDARGWHAGRRAAETADLGSGRDQVRG